jgi:hypothetical protein
VLARSIGILRMAIAETVSTPEKIEAEVQHLFSVFSK